jgi:hypothetical protein
MSYVVKAVCLSLLVAMLGAAGNANAVIRSPFPSRPIPPYQGSYIFTGHDSLTVAPKTVKPTAVR